MTEPTVEEPRRTEPPEARDYCPRCNVAYEPLQEYCLECGERLPTNQGVVGFLASRWQRRLAWYPGDWVWPVLVFFVLTVVATAAAVAAGSTRRHASPTLAATGTPVTVGPGAPQATVATVAPTGTLPTAPKPTISHGTLPTPPGAPSTGSVTIPPPAAARNPKGIASWPKATTGWTLVLESLPFADGRTNAVAHALFAKQKGLPQSGVLVSSQFSSLHPGYYVVFSGIYADQGQASAALAAAHGRGFPDAYVTRVTR